MKKVLLLLIAIAFILGQIARVQQGNIAFTLIDIVVGLVSVGLVIGWVIKRKKVTLNQYTKPLLGFLASGIIGLILFAHNLTPTQIVISLLYPFRLILYLLLIFPLIGLSQKEKGFTHKVVILAGTILVLLGFVQYLFYPALKNLYYLGWDDHLYRLFSTFLDPNFAGAYFALLTIFMLGQIFSAKARREQVIYSIITALTIIALLLTYSRTGFIMLLVGVGVFLLSFVGKKITIGVLSVCILLFILSANTKLEGLNPLRIASSEARISTAQTALKIISNYPIFGVGFDTYRYAQVNMGYRQENPKFPSHADASTDNSYLFVLATTGVIGFGFFVWFWLAVVTSVRQQAREGNMTAQSLFAAICSLFVGSLFINIMFYPMILLWIITTTGLIGKFSKK